MGKHANSIYEWERKNGFKNNSVSAIKCQNRPKYDYIASLDESLELAFLKYYEDMDQLFLNMQDMWYDLEDRNLLYKFSIYVMDFGLYSKKNGFITAAPKIIFRIETRTGHTCYLKYKKIYQLYKDKYEVSTNTWQYLD